MQEVYLSHTIIGEYGIFTNGILVMSLTREQYDKFKSNKKAFSEYCTQLGFKPVYK